MLYYGALCHKKVIIATTINMGARNGYYYLN